MVPLSPLTRLVLVPAAAVLLSGSTAHAELLIYETALNLDGSPIAGNASGGPSGTNNTIPLAAFSTTISRVYVPTGAGGGVLSGVDFHPARIDGAAGPQSSTLAARAAGQTPLKSVQIDIYQPVGGASAGQAKPIARWTYLRPIVTDYTGDAGAEAYDLDGYAAVRYQFYNYNSDYSTVIGTYDQLWNRVTNAPSSSFFVADTAVVDGDVSGLSFVTAAGVPEPVAAAGLSIGGLLLRRRRRRVVVGR